ncbi:hypothetical protein EH802P2_00043 [Enterococcus phage EH802P2]|nr:hypothetical protein EH802P1_00056 [Enterococcus phage EH802P1]WAX16148.1 hypothetical protein EH802P2_00043 [Enterococcus phage EH802P2]
MSLLKAIGYTLWKWFVTLVLFLAVAITFTFSLSWALEGMTHLFGENAIAVGALGVIGVCFIILFVVEVIEAYEEKFKED